MLYEHEVLLTKTAYRVSLSHLSFEFASINLPLEDILDHIPHVMSQDVSRPKESAVMASNWLSFIGSFMIIAQVPWVIRQVPQQRKRMIIIMCTAISNLGFSFANIVTDFTKASTFLACSISAWCYVYFQLLTGSLLIVGTFRLCGVFLFTERRSIPSKYIAICPVLAFILATMPAAAQQFDFNECGHYCWFILTPTQTDCKVRSLWAWLCYYGWMIVFLFILLGSSVYVFIWIAIAVMHSRSVLKQVANQSLDRVIVETPAAQSTSALNKLRSVSQGIQSRTASLFSFESHRRDSGSSSQQEAVPAGEYGGHDASDISTGSGDHFITMASFELSPATVREECGEAASSAATRPLQNESLPPIPALDCTNCPEKRPVSSTNQRQFFIAIFRQALYPISISVAGCIQMIVDLTLASKNDFADPIDYVANVGTSIQGFLFFLVFFFDPAMIQTRRQWRKYLIWKYYVEFYYSIGMPHEGREFQDKFLAKCQALDRPGNETKFDRLARPPSYSWSLQYDHLAMPREFQTTYPLEGVTPTLSPPLPTLPPPRSYVQSYSNEQQRGVGDSLFRPTALSRSIPEDDETYLALTPTADSYGVSASAPVVDQNSRASIGTDYTHSFLNPSSEPCFRSPDKEDARIHPMMQVNIPTAPEDAHVNDIQEQEVGIIRLGLDSSDSIHSQPAPAESLEGQGISIPSASSEGLKSTVTSMSPHGHRDSIASTSISSYSNTRLSDGRATSSHRRTSEASAGGLHRSDSDVDSYLDMDGPQRRNTSITLTAGRPGDVLSFPKLARVSTIGGSDIIHIRQNRTMDPRPSRASSDWAARAGSRVPTSINMVSPTSWWKRPLQTLRYFVLPPRGNVHPLQEKYQRPFRFPRVAYLLHIIIRLIFLPPEVRLPPIANPFKNKCRNDGMSHSESRQPESLSTVQVIDSTHLQWNEVEGNRLAASSGGAEQASDTSAETSAVTVDY